MINTYLTGWLDNELNAIKYEIKKKKKNVEDSRYISNCLVLTNNKIS